MAEQRVSHTGALRHETGRSRIDQRGGVKSYHLSHRIVDFDHLTRPLYDDVAFTRTQAGVVDANKSVWDRAAAITEEGTFLAERIEGLIARLQLGEDVQAELDLITETRETLALNPDDPSQFASIKTNAEEIATVVGKLTSDNTELWYSSVKQTYDEITSTVSVLNLGLEHPDWSAKQFTSIKQTAAEIESVVSTLNSTPDASGQFSSIKQTASAISSVVATLELDPDDAEQYSSIRQLVDEIDLRVRSDEVVAAINLSTEGVRILGKQIKLDGDVEVAGTFKVGSANIDNLAVKTIHVDNEQLTPNKLLWRTPGTTYEVVSSNAQVQKSFHSEAAEVWKAKEFLVNWPGKYTIELESRYEADSGTAFPTNLYWAAVTTGFDWWPGQTHPAYMERVGALTTPQNIPAGSYDTQATDMEVHIGTGQRIAILVYFEPDSGDDESDPSSGEVYIRNARLLSDKPNDGDIGGGMSTQSLD